MAKPTTTIAPLHSTWHLVANASDRIAALVTEIPGWDGYEYTDTTQDELQRVAALLQQAIPTLEQASEREAQRLREEV